MPVFPSINTLIQKPTLDGTEVIQISATEKTTLNQLVQQLGNKGVLTNFTPATPLGDANITISGSDTILSAFEKLYGRIGGDKLQIIPVRDYDGDEYARIVVRSIGLNDGMPFLGGIEWDQTSVKFYYLNGNEDPDIADYSDPQDMWEHVHGDGYGIRLSQEDNLRVISSTGITIFPGDVVWWTGSSGSIVLNINDWPPATSLGNTIDLLKGYSAMVLATSVNITKSMISYTNQGANSVVLLFSDDFDSNPGTTHQCITIQLVRASSGVRAFLINKCGYSES